MNKLKTFGIIVLLMCGIYIAGNYYYVLSTERECGFNPINHLKARVNELWCSCSKNSTIVDYYGGFSCMNCERFCNKYKLGDYNE